MSVTKVIEVVGRSTESSDAAVKNALAEALPLDGGTGGTADPLLLGSFVTGRIEMDPLQGVVQLPRAALREQVASVDLVVDATDNFRTRDSLNQACIEAGKPLVSGAAIRLVFLIGVWGAMVTSLIGVWQGVPYLFAETLQQHSWRYSTRHKMLSFTTITWISPLTCPKFFSL